MNKSETTKAKIFDAAKKLFWNYGYSNISLRQIANIAKIDVALIPRYFGSKLGLFKTTLKDAFEWIDTIDINDSNVADIFIKGLLEGMDIKEETTIIKMLIMNASDPIVGNLVRNTHQKKMRNPILKNLKKISPIQFDLMGSVLIGISQTRKTLRAPALVSLKKTEYEKLLNYILTAATSFKHK